MTVQRFLWIMGMTTLLCWVAVGIIVVKIDPTIAGVSAFLLFYVASFFAVWGLASIIGFFFRYLLRRSVPPFTYIGTTLRQALWFAIFLCLALFLLSQELFDWWMGIPLVIGFASIEAFFLSQEYERKTASHTALNEHDEYDS